MAGGLLMKLDVKEVCQGLLRRLGYKVQRVQRGDYVSRETIVAQTGEDAAYYTKYSTRWPIFAPWVGQPDFLAVYKEGAALALGSPERAYMLISLACHAKHLSGGFAECGVYRGGSALWLCRILNETGKTLYLFDSFEGLPKSHPKHDPYFREGQMAATVASVKQQLSSFQHITEFREGWIPNTFIGLERKQYAFAHIDVDLYQPTLDCCAYFYPRLTPGSILLFDEYGFPSAHGEKVAVDEYFADKPEKPIALVTGQALVLKVPSNQEKSALTSGSF
jgi:O-methyltransferase